MSNVVYGRVALVNPRWTFEGSRFWACQEQHLPLELLYSAALLKETGVESQVVDAHLEGLSPAKTAERVAALDPDLIVVTTAPSYLFWRCPQPELEVPSHFARALAPVAPVVAVGPHGSASPGYVMEQLGCAAVVRGEPEEALVRVALGESSDATAWANAPDGRVRTIAEVDVRRLPPLDYAGYPFELRAHRHHLFYGEGRGAEVEFSRGCPYACSFCNRRFFRGRYRERPLDRVMAELGALASLGVDYVYFIDEVFGLGGSGHLLDALCSERLLQFGCQTRLDLWDEDRLDHLASAGCVSLEFGLESPFPEGQSALNKGYSLEPSRVLELMLHVKSKIPWVQADLVEVPGASADLEARTRAWRQEAIERGVWLSDPVPLFLYPGSDLHDRFLGPVDEHSWTRASTCGC